MVYKFLEKKNSNSGIKNANFSEQQVAEELHKPIIKKFKKTLKDFNCKPNKIWVDKGSEFYKRSMKL